MTPNQLNASLLFLPLPRSANSLSILYNGVGTRIVMSPTEPRRVPILATNRFSIPPWLRAWGPAIFWAAIIFTFSTDSFSAENTSLVFEPLIRRLFPSISPDALELTHHLIRKAAHFTEYFIFFLLLYHAIRATRRNSRPWHWSWALLAWLIAAIYSVTDELHQVLVPSRGPSAWDSLLDSTGALFALFVVYLIYRRYLRTPSE